MAEIPFWVYDRPKWVSGITASTSCADVLHSLASCLPDDEGHKGLILTEKWRDVERPLSSEAKILKIWTAWGDEKKFVKFVVKRVSQRSNNHRKRLRRRGSISSVDEMHPKALAKANHQQPKEDKDVIEEMMKIIEIQRKVITEELKKAKKRVHERKEESSKSEVKIVLDEMIKLSHLNDKLQFAEESVDRLEIALKQQMEGQLIDEHVACAKTEVSRLRSANDQAAIEVKDNQKALDKMEEAKAERKLALKRLEYDVNVIEKEGRKLAKEYEKVLSIKIEDIVSDDDEDEDEEEEIYALLNSSSTSSSKTEENVSDTTSSGHSSEDRCSVQDIIAKESPVDEKNVNSNQDENNSDTGLSSLHTSSDEGTYEVGTLV